MYIGALKFSHSYFNVYVARVAPLCFFYTCLRSASALLDIEIDKPMNIFEDNSGAVSIAKFGNFTKRSKYIEVHYNFVNENYVNGLIDIVKVSTEKNVADILTKALGRVRFEKLRTLLNVI